MSKTKDWLMDLEEAQAYGVSIDALPALREELEQMRLEAERNETAERAKRVPSYIPVEPEDDGLPF